MNCPASSEVHKILFQPSHNTSKTELIDHAQNCAKCRELIIKYIDLRKWLLKYESFSSDTTDSSRCYSSVQILDYLENHYSRHKTNEIQLHLAGCSNCLNEVVHMQRYLSELRQMRNILGTSKKYYLPERFSVRLVYTALQKFITGIKPLIPSYHYAALITLAVITLASFSLYYISSDNKITTRDKILTEEMPEIRFISPGPDEVVTTSDITFLWQGPPEVAYYNFILLNDSGDIILENKLLRPENKIPPNIILEPHMNYFWQIEAHLSENMIVLSDMIKFKYLPN